jgi:hypothetical protein
MTGETKMTGEIKERAFEIVVDGRRIPAREGQTIGAALLAADFRALRVTRFGGRPRGLFCGIGMCFDCLVVVNQRRPQRACLLPASPGDVVTTAGRPENGATS